MTEWEGRIVQNGQAVAFSFAKDRDAMMAKLTHYALVFGQDGPVEMQVKAPGQRRRKAA